MTATTATVSAQSVVVVGPGVVSKPIPAASFIYGSPIPTPILVNPVTGLAASPTYHSYPASPTYYSYPIRRAVVNSTLFNPVLVNPTIRNSTLINPVIVNDRGLGVPVRRGSRLFIRHP